MVITYDYGRYTSVVLILLGNYYNFISENHELSTSDLYPFSNFIIGIWKNKLGEWKADIFQT